MADVSKIKLTDNTEYDIKDAIARQSIATTDEKTDEIIEQLNNPTYTTTEGTDLSINNTRVGKMKFKYYGDTEQETTTGKNLFDGIFRQGIAAGDGNTARLFSNTGVLLTNGETYTISTNLDTTIFNYALVGSLTQYPSNTVVSIGTWNTTSSYTFTATNNYYLGITIKRINEGTITPSDVANYWFQLEKGSTATSYEPYTGGIASPNPDYPQEVKTVTGENTIDITNSNLYNKDTTVVGFLANNGTFSPSVTTWNTSDYIKIVGGESYNFNFEPVVTGNYWQTRAVYYDKNKQWISGADLSTYPQNYTQTFTAPSGAYYVRMSFTNANTYERKDIQVNTGSTASNYEEHQSQSYNINLGKNLLNPKNIYLGKAWNNADNTARAIAYVPLNVGDTYTISMQNTSAVDMILYNFSSTSVLPYSTAPNAISTTTTITATEKYLYFQFNKTNITTDDILAIKIQIEKGSQATSFEKHFEPIELCDIEEHQDYIYNNGGKWFKHKEVGKIIPTGTETITTRSNTSTTHSKFVIANILPTESAGHFLLRSSHFKVGNANDAAISIDCICSNNTTNYRKYLYFSVNNNIADTTTAFGTWLANNNISVYYVLATPVEEEITEPTLINQLNAIKYGAESYYGQTNIIITNEELQPILKVQTMDKIV